MTRTSQKWTALFVAASVIAGGYVAGHTDAGSTFLRVASNLRAKAGDAEYAEGIVAQSLSSRGNTVEGLQTFQNQKLIEQNERIIAQNDEIIRLLKEK